MTAVGCGCTSGTAFPALEVLVQHAVTHEPLQGATVTATESDGTSSGFLPLVMPNGAYRSQRSLQGQDVEVSVSLSGFESARQMVRVAGDSGGCNLPTQVTIELRPRSGP
jgi:hypothetical protein